MLCNNNEKFTKSAFWPLKISSGVCPMKREAGVIPGRSRHCDRELRNIIHWSGSRQSGKEFRSKDLKSGDLLIFENALASDRDHSAKCSCCHFWRCLLCVCFFSRTEVRLFLRRILGTSYERMIRYETSENMDGVAPVRCIAALRLRRRNGGRSISCFR